MNDGVLSMIMILSMIILLLSGWREDLARGIGKRDLFLFFTIWCIGMWIEIPLGSAIILQGVYIAMGLILLRLFLIAQLGTVIYVIVAGLMSGFIGHFIHQLYMADPVLLVFSPEADIALVIGLLAWAVSREALPQVTVVTLAWLTFELAGWRGDAWHTPVHLGGPAIQDQWWVTVGFARALTLTSELSVRIAKAAIKQFTIGYRVLESKWIGWVAKREDE